MSPNIRFSKYFTIFTLYKTGKVLRIIYKKIYTNYIINALFKNGFYCTIYIFITIFRNEKKMFKRKTKKSLFSKSNQNGMVAFSLLKWSMILRTSFWSRYTSTRRQRKFEVNIPPKKALLKQEWIEIGFCVVNPTFTICIS